MLNLLSKKEGGKMFGTDIDSKGPFKSFCANIPNEMIWDKDLSDGAYVLCVAILTARKYYETAEICELWLDDAIGFSKFKMKKYMKEIENSKWLK